MAVRMGVPQVTSVESDHAFGTAVRETVRREVGDVAFRMVLPGLGPTGAWGFPTDTANCRKWPRYATHVWQILDSIPASPDFILVDGRFRVASFLASLPSAQPGAQILFDDYRGRTKQYGVAETHVPVHRFIGRSALFEVPERFDMRRAAMHPANYAVNPA